MHKSICDVPGAYFKENQNIVKERAVACVKYALAHDCPFYPDAKGEWKAFTEKQGLPDVTADFTAAEARAATRRVEMLHVALQRSVGTAPTASSINKVNVNHCCRCLCCCYVYNLNRYLHRHRQVENCADYRRESSALCEQL